LSSWRGIPWSSRSARPFLDLAPAFEAHAGTRLYVDGIHLTREGHEIAVRELLGRLEREGMLP
jgi:hypothetical protein